MIVFPNAKINLGLNILRKRTDNFHDLQSIFLPINLKDSLEVIINEKINNYSFSNSGLKIDAPADKNLVVKAYSLLKNDFNLPAIEIHLHKIIPFGAGLGGGSSDASFMLKLLNEIFELNLSNEQLKNYAREIGSDCAFFIDNRPSLATQKGDVLEGIKINLQNYKIILIKPEISLNTAKVYSYITPNEDVPDLKNLIKKPIESWKKYFFNDFERVIFDRHPEIEQIKSELYKKGAVYASMSGSGSSIYGIFEPNFDMENFNLEINNVNYKTWNLKIIF